jgi:hypothetical protein
MPDNAEEFEVLEKPKRAPRKRASSSVSRTTTDKPKRTRRVTKKVEEEKEEKQPARRAPTPIASEKREKRFVRKHTIVVAVLVFLGIGSSAIVGLTDKGQIDVVTIIDERNKKAAERGETLVSAEEELLPDGGLIPADPAQVQNTPPPPAASSTASTTPVGNIPLTNEEAAAQMQAATST